MNKIHIMLFLFVSSWLNAQQEGTKIQLLLNENNPLSFAHCQYNKQQLISDEEGYIVLPKDIHAELLISHIATGTIKIGAYDLKSANTSGQLIIPESLITLQPATIIARTRQGGKGLLVTPGDKLSHDAGQFLLQSAAISGVRKSGAYGVDPVLRGFKYDRLNIVMDGCINATAACPNRMDPPTSQVAMNMVERIEILKGPYALRYGNGFGGTIHFISETPYFGTGQPLFGRLTSGYESNGNILRTEAQAGYSTETVDLQIYGSYNNGQDYTDGDANTIQADFNRTNLGTNLAVKLSDKQYVSLSAMHNYAKDVDFPTLNMDLRKDNTWLFRLNHSYKNNVGILRGINTSIYTSMVDHEMDNLSKNLDPRMLNAITLANTKNYGGRSEAQIIMGAANLYAGLDIKFEEADGYRTREMLLGMNAGKTPKDNLWQKGIINKNALFTEYSKKFGMNTLIGAARIELNTAEIREPDNIFELANDDVTSSEANTSLSVGFQRKLSKNLKTGIWIGRSERSGSLTERFINYLPVGLDNYERVGNINLKKELNTQIDVDISYNTNATVMRLDVFASYLNNYISAVIDTSLKPRIMTAGGVKQYQNIGHALLTGAELNIKQILPAKIMLQLDMAYTYGQNLELDEPLAEIAPLDIRLNLGRSFLKNTLQPEIIVRYVSAQERVSETFGEATSSEFNTVDIKLNYEFSEWGSVSLAANNLFDTHYYEHLSRPMKGAVSGPIYAPGRSVMANLSVQW